MADPLTTKTEALYQKDGTLYTHESILSGLVPLSSLPEATQTLFKAPTASETDSEPFILTTPSTIFHAQGGGQPSDTGTITTKTASQNQEQPTVFHVHQVRKIDPAILHMGVFTPATSRFPQIQDQDSQKDHQQQQQQPLLLQELDTPKRILHSRLHTAGHALALAINMLKSSDSSSSGIPSSLIDGKASHYPGSSFVEFSGLIPGTAKTAIQSKVDELVSLDLPVTIHFWDEARVRKECTGGEFLGEGEIKGDEVDGVRVVRFGDAGSYPCGGTHVESLKGVGRVLVRGIKRQKGVSKVSYEVVDA